MKTPSSAFTWSVEQSGLLTAVDDLLLTVFCTGGDGSHLKITKKHVPLFFHIQPDSSISRKGQIIELQNETKVHRNV